jgi:hypothetical protein
MYNRFTYISEGAEMHYSLNRIFLEAKSYLIPVSEIPQNKFAPENKLPVAANQIIKDNGFETAFV